MFDARRIEELAKTLVRIPSVNNTTGEGTVAVAVAAHLRSLEYFKKHPDQVWEVPLKNDRFGRKNVFAFVRGEAHRSPTTVILHGHTDTVGVEDFGAHQPYAFDPVALDREYRTAILPPDARQDLESGDWIFGRGIVDMKGGVAVHLEVLRALSERAGTLTGNALFMANPVEENQHTGVMESLPVLKALGEREKLSYALAINTDYIAPLFAGDAKRYVYLGAVGKLLACFYVKGKETHVGECFKGFNPNMVAAELLRSIDLNVDLCDVFQGEYTHPPVSLKATDLKPSYNVQTPLAAFLYFNWFLHDQSAEEVLGILKSKAREAVAVSLRYQREQHAKFSRAAGQEHRPVEIECEVVDYEELHRRVREEAGPGLDVRLKALVADLQSKGTDSRIVCLKVVEEVVAARKEQSPIVVAYFSPPYCPKNTIKGRSAEEKRVAGIIQQVVKQTAAEAGEQFEIRRFFPCLSDSSYLAMDDSDASVAALIGSFPEWHSVYPVPIQEIREANIPAINMGCYGKDAHGWTERLYRPYSFSVLPGLILRTLEKVLHGQ